MLIYVGRSDGLTAIDTKGDAAMLSIVEWGEYGGVLWCANAQCGRQIAAREHSAVVVAYAGIMCLSVILCDSCSTLVEAEEKELLAYWDRNRLVNKEGGN